MRSLKSRMLKFMNVLMRLIMLIFLIYLPIRTGIEMVEEQKIINKKEKVIKEEILSNVKDNFLIRKSNFYEDDEYKKKFQELKRK